MSKRVAIYSRVSTNHQATDGFSIEAQISLLKEYCKKQGYEVVAVYSDKGISGKNMNRPALIEMNQAAKKGKFDIIGVYKANRLARSTADLLKMVEEYQRYNIEFYSHTEQFDTTNAAGKLMMQILASMAEYERNQIVENVTMGQIKRSKDGYRNGTQLLGYGQIPGDKRNLCIIPHEAEIIVRIFNEYASGKGYRAIANSLNQSGLKTKRNNPFDIAAVKYILKNPAYIGMVRFRQYVNWQEKRRRGYNPDPILVEGKHPAIIDKKLWDKVHRRMEAASKQPQVHGKGTNVLTGLLRCPQCGYACAASNTTNTVKGEKKRIRYYSCSQFRNKGSKVCSANSIRADLAESHVFSRIIEVINDEKVLSEVVARVNEKRKTAPAAMNQDIAHKEFQLEEIKGKIDNLQSAIVSSPDLTAVLQDSISSLQLEQQSVETSIQALKTKQIKEFKPLNVDEIRRILSIIFKDMEAMEKFQLKALYLAVIDAIHYQKNPDNKKEFFITLKINEEILKEIFDNQPPEETLVVSPGVLRHETLYIEI